MWEFRSHFTAAADKLIVVIRASRVDLAGGGWVGEDDGMTLSSGDCVWGGGMAGELHLRHGVCTLVRLRRNTRVTRVLRRPTLR